METCLNDHSQPPAATEAQPQAATSPTAQPLSATLARTVTGSAPDGREGRDILRHLASLSLTKAGDGLADPKLVLSWLMAQLGAASWMVGLLVPVREAGSLLPQLFTAARLRAVARRKRVWAVAAGVQGVALLVMAGAGLTLTGGAAGLAILMALAVLALARSAASVTYKAVLGSTVSRGRRGAVTGAATSVGSVATILFALALMSGWVDRAALVIGALVLAGAAFAAAGLVFATMEEPPNADKAEGARSLSDVLSPLREDAQLRRFIAARGLLTATALAPPYLVLLSSGAARDALEGLGALVLASALAAVISGAVWGRFADRSSRRVLMVAGGLGAASMLAAQALVASGLAWALPGALFTLMLAHQGVRVSRATHLVDMAPEGRRADYAAVSNTLIGVVLLGTGIFGALASIAGEGVTLAVFACMAVAGGAIALTLTDPKEAA
jgi:hypothetical protein